MSHPTKLAHTRAFIRGCAGAARAFLTHPTTRRWVFIVITTLAAAAAAVATYAINRPASQWAAVILGILAAGTTTGLILTLTDRGVSE